MLCEVAFLQRRRLLGFHHHQSRGRCSLHRLLCLAKGLPHHFGIEEMSRMIPPSSPTLLMIVSRWIRTVSFKVNSRQSSNEETNNSISQKELSSLSVTSATTIPTKKGPLFGYPGMWLCLTTTTLLASNKMAPLTASCSISVISVSLAVRSSVVEKSNGRGGYLVLCMRTIEAYLHCPWYFDFKRSVDRLLAYA